ncbi:bifunctional DNA primase/polymerase [Aliiruegeria lutimaris]|uniref:bifunctional DNA primase/polymerase n=1 Tax=Aliiruegeria lutimaris TaxID=571298 RepID=UPI0031388DF7
MTMGIPVFPVRVQKIGEKWQKTPLTQHGHLDASLDIDAHDWEGRCNGVGILMGHGLYALDLDIYKPGSAPEQWLKKHGLTGDTRVHRTVSGGLHAIYRTPAKFSDLPSRAGIVVGLDGRGAGGWIAFGEGYRVVRPKPLAMLTDSACKEIIRGYSGGSGVGRLDLPEYTQLTTEQKADVMGRLEVKILVGARIAGRWEGMTGGLKEQARSRSAMDFSTAHMLARAGFTFDEIVFLLVKKFQHGQAANSPSVSQPRAACRCAAAAIRSLEKDYIAPALVQPATSEEDEAEFFATIGGKT